MDPVPSRDVAGDRGGLRDLVLVVREDVVDTAGVDVEARSEVAHGHRRALEMPAREPLAPAGRRPLEETSGAGRLPQREVGRIALVRFDIASMAGAQVGKAVARELTVMRETADVVIDVAIGRRVRVAGVLEPFSERDHLRDVLGGAWKDMRRQDV